MFKLYKDAFKITTDMMILVIPFVVFTFILTLYIVFSKSSLDSVVQILLTFITVLFMLSAFMSGWFYMVKKAIKLSGKVFVLDSDRAKATLSLIKMIPTGIGKYFLSFLTMNLLLIFLIICLSAIVHFIGMSLIGDIGIEHSAIKSALLSSENSRQFLESLTFEQLIKLNNWNMLILFFTTICSFLLMLWIPEIIYETSNSFMALFKSIFKLFSNFCKSLKLFVFYCVINFVFSLFNTFFTENYILYFIILMLYFYFCVYIVVLVFMYYDQEFK